MKIVAWNNAFWPRLTPFGLLLWQADADIDMTLSASPTTAVGQKALALAKRRFSTVIYIVASQVGLDRAISPLSTD